MTRPPDFLIVGTPRSGTTLAQRLASEHPDCSLPPETHFFVHLYPRLLKRGVTFPLESRVLKASLEDYLKLPTSAGLALEPDRLMSDYPQAGERPMALFGAIVRHLAEASEQVGEKTPDHLLWWRPITRAFGHVRIIWIARDPRGVVASGLKVPWGMKSPALLAERWRLDVRCMRNAQRVLGLDRMLVVRFEDIVTAPDKGRNEMWRFLDLPAHVAPRQVEDSMLRNPRETWKARAGGPITSARSDAWQDDLPKEVADLVAGICRREMIALGYQVGVVERPRRTIDPLEMAKRTYLRVNRARKQAWIHRQRL